MSRLFPMILLSLLVAGCHSRQAPTSGGKPISHWLAALRSSDTNARKTAAFKLGNVGSTDPAVLPALLAALKDANPAVRRESILALVKCGPPAKEAIPSLAELQKFDPDSKVRTCARLALNKLGGEVGG
jgi:HEAT repeat protein